MIRRSAISALALLLGTVALSSQATQDESWLTWSEDQALSIGRRAYAQGRVGGWFDTRLLKTERSYNYKLAASWLTREAVTATARAAQLRERLTDDQARALVRDASAAGDTVVLVEIDPREGSGVIPLDWAAFLQPVLPDDTRGPAVRGVVNPELRQLKALTGVMRRNYDYDRFWVVFSLTHEDRSPVVPDTAKAVELVVRIHEQEGRVSWPVPLSVRRWTP